MAFITELWLAILLASVACFILSSLAWTALPHHNNDFNALPDFDGFTDVLKSQNIKPGVYMFPYCEDQKQMTTPEFQDVYSKGPWGMLNLWASKPTMGANLILTLVYFMIVSALIGYVGFESLGTGAGALRVFQITGTVGALAYCASGILNTIWFRVPVRNVLMGLMDGLAYGLATGAVFAWLWPAASTVVGV
ncbi:MAG: hypothetical protein ACF8MJ_02690 [Phycisphaerales bacterium JB050]